MKKESAYVSQIFQNGEIQLLFPDKSFLIASVDKINNKVPTIEDVKQLHEKNIEFIITRYLAASTILIEI